MAAYSQDPRSLFARFLWDETDVRFFNDTDREVLFVIADEEFTLKRTTNAEAGASINEDDELGLLPVSLSARTSRSTEMTQSALRTRFMPVAPRSNSSQHFREERLTYVTALTKEEDGEDKPWTRIHYENKVINCKKTKALKFSQKHLKITAWTLKQKARMALVNGVSNVAQLENASSSGMNPVLALPAPVVTKKPALLSAGSVRKLQEISTESPRVERRTKRSRVSVKPPVSSEAPKSPGCVSQEN